MKAAVLEKINAPLTIADVELTEPAFGQVVVKVISSGICGTQLQEIAGTKNNAKFIPHLLGHEGCGIVEKIGAGVTKVKKGDKVVMHWRKGDGIESDFPTYIFKGKTIQSGKVTTFSEYSIVSENRLTSIPHDIPNDFCTLLGCGLSTAISAIANDAQVSSGESVMVIGLGGLGASLIKAARLSGANPIIAVDIHDSKRDILNSLKGNLFINNAKENIEEIMESKLGIKNVDVIIDTTGNAQAVSDTISLLSNDGRYVIAGWFKPGQSLEIKNPNLLFNGVKGKILKATQGGKFNPTEDIPRFVKLYESKLLDIEGLVSHRTTLDNINEAMDLMRSGKANRIIIDL